MKSEVRSILPVTLWGTGGMLAACIALYIAWPELAEEVPLPNVLGKALAFVAFFLCMPFLVCICPQSIHLVEKGIMFQLGSRGSFFPYDQVVSISFSHDLGYRQIIVKVGNKKGKIVERDAYVSSKVSDQDIVALLAHAGHSHLVKWAA